MLKVDHIYKTFNPGTINEKTALNGTTLTLNEGDFVTVIIPGFLAVPIYTLSVRKSSSGVASLQRVPQEPPADPG